MNSILDSIKKMLGIEATYTHFDQDIIININSVLMALMQIGVGPTAGFVITDSTQTWAAFMGDRKDLESVKLYVYLKVRMMFDPPTNSFTMEALERMAKEIEWRLNVQVENTATTTTTTT